MGYLLAIIRILGIVAVYSAFALVGIILHILFFGSGRQRYYWLGFAAQRLARCSCFLFNIRIKVEGEWNPTPGALIVANHVGTPDIFVIGSCFQTFFVSKMAFRDWPLLGILTRLGETIFVDRDRRHEVKATIEQIRGRLESDASVVLFPEGRATDGREIVPFRTPYFEAAILSGRPVLPALIRYHDGNIPSIACWHGVNFGRHILKLLKNPRLDVTVAILPEVTGPDRRHLANEAFRSIQEEFRKKSFERK